MEIKLPLDADGFLRRECPHCDREFKWHDGPANEEAEKQPPFETFYCPLCGVPAGPDSWWTQAQLDLVEGAEQAIVGRELNGILDTAFSGLRNSKFLRVETTGRLDEPDVPDPLVEPDDMTILASPCHAWEPVKVPDDSAAPFHCIVCGSAFAV